MGGSAATSEDVYSYYDTHSHYTTARNAHEAFVQRRLHKNLDPQKMKNGIRESCDSIECPNSRAIVIGFDETGSMGHIPYHFIKDGLKKFIKIIQGDALKYEPHILYTAIGDVRCDEVPLQVTQFEADTRMIDQLGLFYLEGGGGGNDGESYELPWYFLAKHTKIDCYNKRGIKGIYISVGDDKPHDYLTSSQLKEVFGVSESIEVSKYTTTQLRDMASERYLLYHIMVRDGYDYASYRVPETWNSLLGNHVARLDNYEYLPELLATILKMQDGMEKLEAINMLETPEARKVVTSALKGFQVYDEDYNRPIAPDDDKSSDSINFF